jgi:hypothetical protein
LTFPEKDFHELSINAALHSDGIVGGDGAEPADENIEDGLLRLHCNHRHGACELVLAFFGGTRLAFDEEDVSPDGYQTDCQQNNPPVSEQTSFMSSLQYTVLLGLRRGRHRYGLTQNNPDFVLIIIISRINLNNYLANTKFYN